MILDITESVNSEYTPMFELLNDAAPPSVSDSAFIEMLGALKEPSGMVREVPERMRSGEERLPDKDAEVAWMEILVMPDMVPYSSRLLTERIMLPPTHDVVGSIINVPFIDTVVLEV